MTSWRRRVLLSGGHSHGQELFKRTYSSRVSVFQFFHLYRKRQSPPSQTDVLFGRMQRYDNAKKTWQSVGKYSRVYGNISSALFSRCAQTTAANPLFEFWLRFRPENRPSSPQYTWAKTHSYSEFRSAETAFIRPDRGAATRVSKIFSVEKISEVYET